MSGKVPFAMLPKGMSDAVSRYFIGIGSRLANVFPGVKYDLEKTDLEMCEGEYFANAISNALAYFIMFFALLFFLSYATGKELGQSLSIAAAYSLFLFILIIVLFARYPRIMAGKKAERLEKSLVFALKDLLLQVSSGVPLYEALVNVSRENYGEVSTEFGKAAKSVNSGIPIEDALEKMASSTSSDFLRRAVWQLVNTLKAGASLKGALRSIIDDLTAEHKNRIRDYSRELNLWSLMYMLFAVAIPTIGATMLVILSSFAGIGVSRGMFIAFLALNFALQFILIGFVKSRRPVVDV